MAFRPDIIAGRAVILVSIQDNIDRELRRLRTTLRRAGNTLSSIGGDLFRFGALGTAGSLLPIREFQTFDDQILFIQTKLRVTDQEMTKLEGTIRELGRTTSFTSQQVGTAAQQLAQAGFDIGEIQDSLQATLDLARAGGTDLDTAARLIVQAINSFGLATNQAGEIASQFIAAARLAPVDVVDLGEAIKFTSTTADQLNVSLTDVLASLVILGRRGTRGTLSGTQLNTALSNLATQQEKLEELLGVTLSPENFENIAQLFTIINQATKDLNPLERVNVFREIANLRGGRALGPLAQEIEQLGDVTKELEGALTEARVAAVKLDSRLGGAFRRALSAGQELLISVGETVEVPLTNILNGVRRAFEDLGQIVRQNPRFVQFLLSIPPAALAAGSALLILGSAFNRFADLIGPILSINRRIFQVLARVGNLKLLGAGFFFIKQFRSELSILGQVIKNIGNAISQVGQNVSPAFQTILLGLSEIVKGNVLVGIKVLQTGIKDLVDLIKIQLAEAWESLLRRIEPFTSRINEVIKGIARVLGILIKEFNRLPLFGVGNKITGALLDSDLPLGEIFSPERIRNFFKAIANGLEVAIAAVKGFIENLTLTLFNLTLVIGKLRKETEKPPFRLAADPVTVDGISGADRATGSILDLRKSQAELNLQSAKLFIQVSELLRNPEKTARAFFPGFLRIADAIGETLRGRPRPPSPPGGAQTAEEVERALQAVTGTFASTRGQLLKRTEDTQQKQLQALENIEKNTENIKDAAFL